MGPISKGQRRSDSEVYCQKKKACYKNSSLYKKREHIPTHSLSEDFLSSPHSPALASSGEESAANVSCFTELTFCRAADGHNSKPRARLGFRRKADTGKTE